MLSHAARMGIKEPDELTLTTLRGWLAELRTASAARASLARRAAAVRTFSHWAHRTGRLRTDVAALLASPRAHRELPAVLRADQATALVTAPTRDELIAEGGEAPAEKYRASADGHTAPAEQRRVAGDQRLPTGEGHEPANDEAKPSNVELGDALRLRDAVVLELLYASGIRVSELCGLHVDDVDRTRRVVRVMGKGAKERTVPFGVPADRAIEAWLAVGAMVGCQAAARRAARSRRRLNPTTARQIVTAWAATDDCRTCPALLRTLWKRPPRRSDLRSAGAAACLPVQH
jgi:integrase/recombinase XerC